MFIDVGDNHPLVILSDVETSVLKCIIDFVYHGELNVHAAHLNEVLQVAATLQIRGLTEVKDCYSNFLTWLIEGTQTFIHFAFITPPVFVFCIGQ